MDYVRESLMRQQTALAWVLLGTAGIPGEAEGLPGAQPFPGAPDGEGQGADGGAFLESTAGAEAPLLWTEAVQRRQAALRQAEEARAARLVDLAASAAAAAVGLRPRSAGAETGFATDGAAFDERVPGAPGRRWPGVPEEVRSRSGGTEAWDAPAAGPDLSAAGDVPGGAVRSVAEVVVQRPTGRTDPAALSRTFQRDARRYDGGFELY